MSTIERRSYAGEIEVRSHNGRPVIAGYAAVFGAISKPMVKGGRGRFVETVETRAFNKTLGDGAADVIGTVNHDPTQLLGRVGAGTLRVATDTRGLHYEIDPPDTTYARDLQESLERRDAVHSSFGFRTPSRNSEAWSYTPDGMALRSLQEVQLIDVAPLTIPPAYDSATAGLSFRSLVSLAEFRGIDPERLDGVDEDAAFEALLDADADLTTLFAPADDLESRSGDDTPVDLTVQRARLALLERPTWAHRIRA